MTSNIASCLAAALVVSAGVPGEIQRAAPGPADAASLAGLSAGDELALPLSDGATCQGVVDRRRDRGPGRFTLAGTLPGGGRFILAVNGAAVAGVWRQASGTTHRLRARGELERLDVAGTFSCSVADPQAFDGGAGDPPGAAAGGQCGDGSVIDVLFVYTTHAMNDAGGVAEIVAEIDLAVEFNNVAYENSEIAAQWNAVYAYHTGIFTPSLTELADPNDGALDGVHTLRDAYGADQVALIRHGGGGVALGLRDLDPGSQATAFCINGIDSLPFVVSHEIGHNMGCCHAIGDGGGCPGDGLLFEYSNGHRFDGDSGGLMRTIMAYPPGSLIEHFSNPDIFVDGVPTGIAEGQPSAADNARTINLSKLTVSNWRCNDGICEALDLPGDSPDCDGDFVPDGCEIALGAADVNGNGVPDSCECLDINGDQFNGTQELLTILSLWGEVIPGHPVDYDGNDRIWQPDLLILIADWGPCFE